MESTRGFRVRVIRKFRAKLHHGWGTYTKYAILFAPVYIYKKVVYKNFNYKSHSFIGDNNYNRTKKKKKRKNVHTNNTQKDRKTAFTERASYSQRWSESSIGLGFFIFLLGLARSSFNGVVRFSRRQHLRFPRESSLQRSPSTLHFPWLMNFELDCVKYFVLFFFFLLIEIDLITIPIMTVILDWIAFWMCGKCCGFCLI